MKMRARISLLVCVLLLVFSSVAAEEAAIPHAEENAGPGQQAYADFSIQYTASLSDGFVIVRESASNSGKKLFVLPHNTAVAVLSVQGAWSRIRTDDGREGYLANTALSPSPQNSVLLILNQREFSGEEDFYNTGTISEQGCGLIAAINAVYYRTGNLIDIYTARDYMRTHRCFTIGSKNADPTKFFSEFLPQAGVAYIAYHRPSDANWGEKATAEYPESVSEILREHMKAGHFFVASIGDRRYAWRGHYAAIVAYNADTDEFLFLDSDGDGAACTGSRASWQKLTFNPALGYSEPMGRYQLGKAPDMYVYELWEFQ